MEPSSVDKRIQARMEQEKSGRDPSWVRMVPRFLRMFLYRAFKGKWHLPAVSEIHVDELHDRIEADRQPVLIDVRFSGEFDTGFGHIPGSHSIPIHELETRLDEARPFMEREVVTICPGGGMSLVAAEMLAEAGFQDVKSLKGGIDLWFKKGYPTTRS